MKSELIERFRDVNKKYLPILLENKTNQNGSDRSLATHFDSFLDQIQESFQDSKELICIVPTFYQLEDISPWKTREFDYLKAYSLIDRDTFQKTLSAQLTLSSELNTKFSKSVLDHLNSDGWNGRCTVLIKIVENSNDVTLEYDSEFDLHVYKVGESVAKRIKKYVLSIFPDVPDRFNVFGRKKNKRGNIKLNFELDDPQDEIKELRSLVEQQVQIKSDNSIDLFTSNLQKALLEPVLQHIIFLNPGWEMYYSFSNSVQYNRGDQKNNVESDYGLGGAFIIVDKEISLNNDFDRFIMLIERIVDKLANRVVNYYQIEKIENFARASAVSKIFSRNNSHNIGHVKYRASVEHICKRVKELYGIDLLNPIYAPTKEKARELYIELKNLKTKEHQACSGINNCVDDKVIDFIDVFESKIRNYLGFNEDELELFDIEDRLETLPAVSFGEYKYLKSYIYYLKKKLNSFELHRNEFISDYDMPQKNVSFYSEIIIPFATNSLILDNISASEGIRFSEDHFCSGISIHVYINSQKLKAYYPDLKGYQTNQSVCYPDHFPFMLKVAGDSNLPLVGYSEAFRNLQIGQKGEQSNLDQVVMLPSEHAFYSILENFIRNSSKHNKEFLVNGNLDIIIRLNEPPNKRADYFECIITDSVSSMSVKDLFDFIQKKNTPIVQNGAPLGENFGISDMKINAHLLGSGKEINEESLRDALDIVLYCSQLDKVDRKFYSTKNVQTLEQLKNLIDENEISPRGIFDENKKYAFGYKLNIRKSKKLCWIGCSETFSTEQVNLLRNNGIYLYPDLKKFIEKSNKNKPDAWQFALIEPKVFEKINDQPIGNVEEEFYDLLIVLPFRVLINEEYSSLSEDLKNLVKRRRAKAVKSKIKTNTVSVKSNKKLVDDLIELCWINWLHRWSKEKPLNLLLSFEGENEEWEKFHNGLPNVQNGIGKCLSKNINIHLINTTDRLVKDIKNNADERWIIYDQHNKGHNLFKNDFKFGSYFYQINGKNSNDYSTLTYPPEDTFKKRILCYELIESGLLNIAVFDERLCESMYDSENRTELRRLLGDDYSKQLMNRWFFGVWAGIWFGNKFETQKIVNNDGGFSYAIKDKKPVFSTKNKNNLKRWSEIKKNIACSENPIDILVIHRTFLSEQKLGESLETYLKSLRENIPFVIVISGGGKPHGLKGEYRFKPLSQIETKFKSEHFSKYSISKILTS